MAIFNLTPRLTNYFADLTIYFIFQANIIIQNFKKFTFSNFLEISQCQWNTCSNIPFTISFHKDDKKNSLDFLMKNGCFDGLTESRKNRKKRDIFKVKWVKCGPYIAFGFTILSVIGYIVGIIVLAVFFYL